MIRTTLSISTSNAWVATSGFRTSRLLVFVGQLPMLWSVSFYHYLMRIFGSQYTKMWQPPRCVASCKAILISTRRHYDSTELGPEWLRASKAWSAKVSAIRCEIRNGTRLSSRSWRMGFILPGKPVSFPPYDICISGGLPGRCNNKGPRYQE